MGPLFELVKAEVAGMTLHGLAHRPVRERALALHVHGTWGNFYENPFVAPLAQTYAAQGVGFATVNFPGYDGGATHERIEDFGPALRAWLDALGGPGTLILQGHSLGAVKIAWYAAEHGLPPGTVGVVLLSPFDVVAFYGRQLGGDVELLHSRLVGAQPDALVGEDIFDLWPISVRTIRDATTVEGPWDQFPTRWHEAGGSLSGMDSLVLVGGDDFAATPDPRAVAEMFSRVDGARAHLIDGAPHNFAGHEERLAAHVAGWLRDVVPGR